MTKNITWMILRMTQVTSFEVKMTFKRMCYRPTDQPTDRPTDRPTEWDIESLHATKNMMWGMKQECWESISTHFTAFPDLGLPFFECFDIFSFFGFFQFFERDFKKLAWVTQNMTWMILRMTQVTSFMVKMTFKPMRYRQTNRRTDRVGYRVAARD